MKADKFKIGDKVAVIDDIIQGVIIAVNGDNIALEDENGFHYWYKNNEIVLVVEELFNNIKVKIKDKASLKPRKQIVNSKKEIVLEVDLHIHQITKSNKYLSNTNMLLKQIAHAKIKMDFALKNNISKVIFIHGIGQGVLKTELLLLLKEYPVQINDASYRKYGKGAMEVYIYKSKI
jgi:dsDNA-specific endonuclease/ATPase MutS2